MMSNWQIKKIGEVCDIQNGYAFKSVSYRSQGARVIRISNVQNGYISDKSPKFVSLMDLDAYKLFEIYENDILISLTGDVGRVGIFPKKLLPALLNQRVGRVFNLKEDIVLKEYLFHFLNSEFFENTVISSSAGAAQKNTSTKKIKDIELPLPPIKEQKRIVKILNEKFAQIEELKKITELQIKNSRELFESYLENIFSNPGKDWERKTLGDVVETTQGVQVEKRFQVQVQKKGYKRYLYISDFNHEKNLKYIEDKYPKKIVTNNDLIVVNTGASAGRIYRGIDGILSNNLFKVSFSDSILSTDFLYYFVTSNIFKDFQKKIVRGTANPHMGHENFNLTPFTLPPTLMQNNIVKKLDTLSIETKKLETIYKQKLADLEELKKSILQKVFAGEL